MLENIIKEAEQDIKNCTSLNSVNDFKIKYFGKSSLLNAAMSELAKFPTDERKIKGQEINQIRKELQDLYDGKKLILDKEALENKFASERLDLTTPPRITKKGSVHPITQVLEELSQVFSQYGFSVMDGPDIEDDWYNFTALNIDETHPARQMHDTFYLKSSDSVQKNKLLRTHTSPIQIRTMEKGNPPFRFVASGRTYRSDSDMTHTPMFHQIEGLVVDKGINMGHLKYVIIDSIKTFFERDNIEIRFRPSFFPFTEPSAEVDIRMDVNDPWLEVLGCGMVHPNVLKNVDIDTEEYRGFAFGMGLERFAMLKYGIKDLRKFFEGDKRWLDHYNFRYFDIPTLAGGLTR